MVKGISSPPLVHFLASLASCMHLHMNSRNYEYVFWLHIFFAASLTPRGFSARAGSGVMASHTAPRGRRWVLQTLQ